ncbi:MAG: hypothetical protein FJY56_11295 [Betaproteobacteria bacterium]|nr:hypothetical protein [Betaproteobacteria bacterium]
MKIRMAILLLGGMLVMQPVTASSLEGIAFSLQAQGAGKGQRNEGRAPREVRTPPAPQPQRGQLSAEDRRQLQRDVEKANRELYRGKR